MGDVKKIEINLTPLQVIHDPNDRTQIKNIMEFALQIALLGYECQFYDVITKEDEYVIFCDFPGKTSFSVNAIIKVYAASPCMIKDIFVMRHEEYQRLEMHVRKSTAPLYKTIEEIHTTITRMTVLEHRGVQMIYEYDEVHDSSNGFNKKKIKTEVKTEKIKIEK
jgi:hypothetical protein